MGFCCCERRRRRDGRFCRARLRNVVDRPTISTKRSSRPLKRIQAAIGHSSAITTASTLLQKGRPGKCTSMGVARAGGDSQLFLGSMPVSFFKMTLARCSSISRPFR